MCALVWCDVSLSIAFIDVSFSFAVDSMIEETMCTRIFGTTILVKNLHVGTKGMMNIHDLFAVAVLKSDVIVGHIPRAISAACYVFLGRAGSTK